MSWFDHSDDWCRVITGGVAEPEKRNMSIIWSCSISINKKWSGRSCVEAEAEAEARLKGVG